MPPTGAPLSYNLEELLQFKAVQFVPPLAPGAPSLELPPHVYAAIRRLCIKHDLRWNEDPAANGGDELVSTAPHPPTEWALAFRVPSDVEHTPYGDLLVPAGTFSVLQTQRKAYRIGPPLGDWHPVDQSGVVSLLTRDLSVPPVPDYESPTVRTLSQNLPLVSGVQVAFQTHGGEQTAVNLFDVYSCGPAIIAVYADLAPLTVPHAWIARAREYFLAHPTRNAATFTGAVAAVGLTATRAAAALNTNGVSSERVVYAAVYLAYTDTRVQYSILQAIWHKFATRDLAFNQALAGKAHTRCPRWFFPATSVVLLLLSFSLAGFYFAAPATSWSLVAPTPEPTLQPTAAPSDVPPPPLPYTSRTAPPTAFGPWFCPPYLPSSACGGCHSSDTSARPARHRHRANPCSTTPGCLGMRSLSTTACSMCTVPRPTSCTTARLVIRS